MIAMDRDQFWREEEWELDTSVSYETGSNAARWDEADG
jgi:hypothetical protein